MKILDCYWFNGGGIVRVQTDYDGVQYYIRGIPTDQMTTQEVDSHYIADYGNSFPKDAGDALFGIRKDMLNQLHDGDAVVLPKSQEHAEAMLRVAQFYLETNRASS